jgi:hypothetical protein
MVNRSPRIRTCGRGLMSPLPHGKQISPDKNVLARRSASARRRELSVHNRRIYPTPEPAGFVVSCQLAHELSRICGFCSSARTFALRLPSDGRSPFRPCLRLVLLVVFICMNTIGSRTGDFHPISSRPCRAYTMACTGSAIKALASR